jgi:hypothetical protein
MKILLLNILPYQNTDKKIMIYFLNMPYVVCYHLAIFELKTLLVYEETKKTNFVKGKLENLQLF